jgi:acetylornithine deacetylase
VTTTTIALLEKLVSFDTTSSKSNLALIDFVREYLASFQVSSELLHNDDGTKANLVATIGPADVAGILLSGHTDVVPALEHDWLSSPFTLTERGGQLFGRGTADMKGFIAAVLAAVPGLVAADLRHPVHLAFSYDEELGCLGVRKLLPAIMALPSRPRLCVIGEPTMMRIVTGHKGKVSCETHIRGHACHSAQAPLGVNAIEYAAEVISFIRSEAQRIRCDGPFSPGYVIPYTTMNVGPITGGIATNVVADSCRFSWEIRHLPDQDPAPIVQRISEYTKCELEPQMHLVAAHTSIETQIRNSYPGLDMDRDQETIALLFSLGGNTSKAKVDFGTEGGFFHTVAGIPTLVFGPGDIAVAHKSNEHIDIAQLDLADQFLHRLTDRLCRSEALTFN